MPAAATVIESARAVNQQLDLLGILISIYNPGDVVQAAMLERLQQAHRELLLEPVIPFQREARDWPLTPGSDPPAGAARLAFAALTQTIDPWTRAAQASVDLSPEDASRA